MRRLPIALAIVALCAGPLPFAAADHKPMHKNERGPKAKPAKPAKPEARCDRDSWLAGAVELCNGRLIYRDYLYDDYGADDPLTPQQATSTTGSLARSAGDARYPEGAESTADLVRLELAAKGNALQVTGELAALHKAGQSLLAIALDTDNNPKTGGGDWKGVEGISSTGWESVTVLKAGDVKGNTVTGTLPLPKGDFRVQAVTAQADGTVMNVAFRGTDEQTVTGAWWDDKQAKALADGDISAFGHVVDRKDLEERRSRPVDHAAPGFHQRVYTSAYTLGEGMTYDAKAGRHGDTGQLCEQGFHFLGKYQPYGVYAPKSKRTDPGVQLALHGCNANHSSLVDLPNMQRQFGEELGRVVVVPLGRGPVGYYSDISERDVLDVMDDVTATYRPDPTQVFSGGYSMGGYGAYRFAALYPHVFAGMVNWVGFTGEVTNNPVTDDTGQSPNGGVGNVIDFIGNLRHIPSALLYSGADELVHVHTGLAMERAFAKTDNVYEFYFHPYADHLTYAVVDDWTKEAAYVKGRRLVQNPPRVTYRTDASLAFPAYGIEHDRAYWVSEIRSRAAGYTDVDVTTRACGGSFPTLTTGNGAGVGPAAFAWVSTKREAGKPTAFAPTASLTGSVKNLTSATLDAGASCLAGKPVTYDVTSDGPATLTLSDGRVLRLVNGANKGVLR